MGVFDMFHGRNDNGRVTHSIADTDNIHDPSERKHPHSVEAGAESGESVPPAYETGSEASFGVNGVLDDEKEREHNPDHVNSKIALGQQKAEAAALVWSRPVVIGIYAW
jgi:hypothetical protein